MLHDTQSESVAGGPIRRVLAVVAGTEAKAQEVSARFAAEGDVVETRWYASTRSLLGETERPHFEAVIVFPEARPEASQAAEERLRAALSDTPLFCVAA